VWTPATKAPNESSFSINSTERLAPTLGSLQFAALVVPRWSPDTEPGVTDLRSGDEIVSKPVAPGFIRTSASASKRFGKAHKGKAKVRP
jgi:hypothetical protein